MSKINLKNYSWGFISTEIKLLWQNISFLMDLIYQAKNIEFLSFQIPVGISIVPSLLLTEVIHVDRTSSTNHNE